MKGGIIQKCLRPKIKYFKISFPNLLEQRLRRAIVGMLRSLIKLQDDRIEQRPPEIRVLRRSPELRIVNLLPIGADQSRKRLTGLLAVRRFRRDGVKRPTVRTHLKIRQQVVLWQFRDLPNRQYYTARAFDEFLIINPLGGLLGCLKQFQLSFKLLSFRCHFDSPSNSRLRLAAPIVIEPISDTRPLPSM